MADKLIQKIFEDSEKAEFLESIEEILPKCRRAIICFESPHDSDKGMTNFQYFQLGFRQSYEVSGFLQWIEEMILEADRRGDSED